MNHATGTGGTTVTESRLNRLKEMQSMRLLVRPCDFDFGDLPENGINVFQNAFYLPILIIALYYPNRACFALLSRQSTLVCS